MFKLSREMVLFQTWMTIGLNSIQMSRLTREGTMPQRHHKLLLSGWKGTIHRDVLIEVWLYMEGRIVVRNISEHTMVVMIH
jgi:hypothetical protein